MTDLSPPAQTSYASIHLQIQNKRASSLSLPSGWRLWIFFIFSSVKSGLFWDCHWFSSTRKDNITTSTPSALKKNHRITQQSLQSNVIILSTSATSSGSFLHLIPNFSVKNRVASCYSSPPLQETSWWISTALPLLLPHTPYIVMTRKVHNIQGAVYPMLCTTAT